jgi:hypothetical protein
MRYLDDFIVSDSYIEHTAAVGNHQRYRDTRLLTIPAFPNKIVLCNWKVTSNSYEVEDCGKGKKGERGGNHNHESPKGYIKIVAAGHKEREDH